MADAIIENSPKKLVVDPLSKKDVESLIKEALSDVKIERQVYEMPRFDYNNDDPDNPYYYCTKEKALEFIEAVKRGDIIKNEDTYYYTPTLTTGIDSETKETNYASIVYTVNWSYNDDNVLAIDSFNGLIMHQSDGDSDIWIVQLAEL